jgi:enoyl-[acyl-carrier protein] reductase I
MLSNLKGDHNMMLQGKKALVVGVASNRSIAYGIAQALHEQGAELALTYQAEKLKPRVEKFAAAWDSTLVFPCDLTSDSDIEAVFSALAETWDGIDIIIHSAAFAPMEELDGDYVDCVTRNGFSIAHDISSYSFAALAKAGRKMMQGREAAMLTMTYQGSERAVVNYNVMGLAKASLEANVRYMAQSLGPEGIRVNAISAGPIRTLAAAGIKDFRKMLSANEQITPLKRNVSIEEVGNTAAFLCSSMARGITGEVLHVDSGFHAVAIGNID